GASEGESIQCRPTHQNGTCAKREGHDNVRAASYAAVEIHLAATPNRIHDFRESVERRNSTIELATAGIRPHDARGTVLACENRILGRYEALHDDRNAPPFAELGDVVPFETRFQQVE